MMILPIHQRIVLFALYIVGIEFILRVAEGIIENDFLIGHSLGQCPGFGSDQASFLKFLGEGGQLLKESRFQLNIFLPRVEIFQSLKQTPLES